MNHQRSWLTSRCWMLLAFLPVLLSCGGGSGSASATRSASSACAKQEGVTSGFSLALLDSDYPDGNGGGGGDGSGSGGGDGGSAGGGGALGKVLNGEVEVHSLVDGRSMGRGTTDPDTGLFTIHICGESEPMLVTLKGNAQATYYDEGKNDQVPFGPDQELHALVDQLDQNIGVSAFTEAAYRYAINSLLIDPDTVRNQTVAMRKAMPPEQLRLTAAQIRQANTRVLDELNRVLPQAYHLASIKALSRPLGTEDFNDPNAVSGKPVYVQTTIATAAFAWMADRFRLNTAQPALVATEEFARDLTDGKWDGFALNGSASSGDAGSAYDSLSLPVNLTVGANAMANAYSASSAANAPELVYRRSLRVQLDMVNALQDTYSLTKNGTIDLYRIRYANNYPVDGSGLWIRGFGANPDPTIKVKNIMAAQWTGAGFFVETKGDVYSWGDALCGQLGNRAAQGYFDQPVKMGGLNNVTSLAAGYNWAVARDNDGHVYSWGEGLALGLAQADITDKCEVWDGQEKKYVEHPANLKPVKIPGLSRILNVYAQGSRGFAIDEDGRLSYWGRGCGRSSDYWRTPTSNDPILSKTRFRSLAATEAGCFALTSEGKLMGWGFQKFAVGPSDGILFGDGSSADKITPTVLAAPSLTDIREVGADKTFFYALKADGSVYVWGGYHTEPEYSIQEFIIARPIKLDSPEPIRHILPHIQDFRLMSVSGKLYVVYPELKDGAPTGKLIVELDPVDRPS